MLLQQTRTARTVDPLSRGIFAALLGNGVFVWNIWGSLPVLPALFRSSTSAASPVRLLSSAKVRECTLGPGRWNYWPEKMNGEVPALAEKVDLYNQARGVWKEIRGGGGDTCRTVWTAMAFQPRSPGNEADIFPDWLWVFFLGVFSVWPDNCGFLRGPNNTTEPLCNESFPPRLI